LSQWPQQTLACFICILPTQLCPLPVEADDGSSGVKEFHVWLGPAERQDMGE